MNSASLKNRKGIPLSIFRNDLTKPVIVFPYQLPHRISEVEIKNKKSIAAACEAIIVMTHNSKRF